MRSPCDLCRAAGVRLSYCDRCVAVWYGTPFDVFSRRCASCAGCCNCKRCLRLPSAYTPPSYSPAQARAVRPSPLASLRVSLARLRLSPRAPPARRRGSVSLGGNRYPRGKRSTGSA